MRRLTAPFRRFARDESASVTVEMVMIFPILMWGYLGMFLLFDGYRALSNNIRAGYTISDMISRETDALDETYITGLRNILEVLTQSPHRTVLRVSVVEYHDPDPNNDDDQYHQLEWSYSTPGMPAITDADFEELLVKYLPPMPNGSQLIVVETWMAHVPFMNMTLEQLFANYDAARDGTANVFGPFYFETRVVTRPRFAGQVIWDGA